MSNIQPLPLAGTLSADIQNANNLWSQVAPRVSTVDPQNAAQSLFPPVQYTPVQTPATLPPSMVGLSQTDERCFSELSAPHAAFLRAMVAAELSDCLYYKMLARKAPTKSAASVLQSMAADEKRHAKSASSALYLITGELYYPIKDIQCPFIPPYRQALRDRYMEESRAAARYNREAGATSDVCLRDMLLTAARDELGHASDIKGLAEQMLG